MPSDQRKPSKRGPDPERLRLEGDWTEATKKALRKKRPEEGWPDADEAPKQGNDAG